MNRSSLLSVALAALLTVLLAGGSAWAASPSTAPNAAASPGSSVRGGGVLTAGGQRYSIVVDAASTAPTATAAGKTSGGFAIAGGGTDTTARSNAITTVTANSAGGRVSGTAITAAGRQVPFTLTVTHQRSGRDQVSVTLAGRTLAGTLTTGAITTAATAPSDPPPSDPVPPTPQTLALAPPTDTPATQSFDLTVRVPPGTASYRFTATADTDVTGISLTNVSGGQSTLTIGPPATESQQRPVVTDSAPWSGHLLVSVRQPLPADLSCTPASGATSCTARVTVTSRAPAPQDYTLSPPTSAPQSAVFDLARPAAADSPARYRILAPANTEITTVTVTDTAGTGNVVTLDSPTGPVVVTSAAPYSGRLLVTPDRPLPVSLTCAPANATTGCSVKLTLTYALARTDLYLAPPTSSTTDQDQIFNVTYTPSGPGLYRLNAPADTQITVVTIAGQGQVYDGQVVFGANRGPDMQPASYTFPRRVNPDHPLNLDYTCGDQATTSCTATLDFKTRLYDPQNPYS